MYHLPGGGTLLNLPPSARTAVGQCMRLVLSRLAHDLANERMWKLLLSIPRLLLGYTPPTRSPITRLP